MKLIFPYLCLEKGRTTDFSYGGLLMWVDYFRYEYCIYRDTLFIKGVTEDDTSLPAFSLPVGALPLDESVDLIKRYCHRHGIRPEFSAVPEHSVEAFALLSPKSILPLEDWGDYLYDIEPMATLAGKKMSKKRNHVNRFMAENPDAETVDLTADNVDEVMDFMDVYDSEADGAPMEIAESRLTRRMLSLIKEGDTHLEGVILRAGGRTAGFSVGDIKGDTLFVHIEKATRTLTGSYETVARAFAARMSEKHPELRFVNREDDGGDEGLRKSKLSYHPVEVLKKFNIIF